MNLNKDDNFDNKSNNNLSVNDVFKKFLSNNTLNEEIFILDDKTIPEEFLNLIEENGDDLYKPFKVEYWHIANILSILGAFDNDVDDIMKTVLDENNLKCTITLSDDKSPFSLNYVFTIFEDIEDIQIHITTLKTNYTNNEVDVNQLYDVANSWNRMHFLPSANIAQCSEKDYVVRTRQIIDITHGANVNQLYLWLDNAISGAFQAQKEIENSYIDL